MTLDTNRLHERWSSMLEELRSEPRVNVLKAKLGRPMTDDDIEAYAGDLGLPLTPDFAALFRFASTIELDWRVDELRGGSIGILGLATSYDEGLWPCGPDAFDRPLRAYGLDLPRARGTVRPLDFFTWAEDSLDVAAMFRHGDDIDVLVTEDHTACQTDTHLVSLGEYVDFLFDSYGCAKARFALNAGTVGRPRAREAIPGILTKHHSLSEVVSLVASEPNVGQRNAFFR